MADLPNGIGEKSFFDARFVPADMLFDRARTPGDTIKHIEAARQVSPNGSDHHVEKDFDAILDRIAMPGFLDELESIVEKNGV